MRKLIIIGLLALAVWLAAMPGLIGVYLRGAVPEWLQESPRGGDIEYNPGWFNSHATYQPGTQTTLRLIARHFPPLKPGWVALSGDLASPFTPNGAQIRAHLGLTGSWHLSAQTAVFSSHPDAGFEARDLMLNVAQIPDQPASLTISAAELDLPEQSAPLLDLRVRGLKQESSDDTVRLGLDIQIRDERLGSARLVAQAGPVSTEHLETFMQAVNQLAASQAGSVSENLALLSLASVWQQMAGSGLSVDLETLRFGDQTLFEGVWVTAEPQPMVTGSGDIQALERWINRLLGSHSSAASSASIDAANLLSSFGHLEMENGGFVFRTLTRRGTQPGPGLQPAP
jgi:hypothetical protein